MVTRRGFLDALAIGVAGFVLRNTAKSYAQIVGSNERVHFAIIGLHGRAYAHLSTSNGHILEDAEAMKRWGREYEKGWEPHV